MTFIRKRYVNGQPVTDTVEYANLSEARSPLEFLFHTDDSVWAIEERRFENGAVGFSIKDKWNKIILQIKTQQ